MESIREIENWTQEEIKQEIANGGKFVVYTVRVAGAISRSSELSRIYFVRSNEKTRLRNVSYAFLAYRSGGIFTSGNWFGAVVENLQGGIDITEEVVSRLFDQLGSDRVANQLDSAIRNRGIAIGRVRCRKCGMDYWAGASKCWKCGAPQAWGQ